MPLQEVSFLADKPAPAPKPDAPPEIALKAVCGILGIPSALAVGYVAIANVAFLAGGAATPVGVVAGVVGGIVASLGFPRC